MTFKEKVHNIWEKKKQDWKEESKFREKERQAYKEAERESRLEYARKRARANEEHRYKQYKKNLNRPSGFGFGGGNDFFSMPKSSGKPRSYFESTPSYYGNKGYPGFPGLGTHAMPKRKRKK